ncbi:unnamed protein product [Arabis nemorensis]|uniref:Uncharacterized protein n=1 Tax=Arabis nemorensis TaxID=586526 RepID=A0A565BP34_9BRAS|nr:unnamed protein product [Arabis nemorensis]
MRDDASSLFTTTWKEKKALENKKVIALGGKPQKKPRVPLSVARNMILGKFGGQVGGVSTKKPAEKKRKPEDRVLKSMVGNFKSGVLDVRHLLHSGSSRINDRDKKIPNYGKIKLGGEIGGGGGKKSKGQKKRGKKNKGKKKGGGKRKGK